ncbi:MAG: GNAT family N-acetyltransferase [Chlamydiae bacterium CG10_big_fil_rev_8_21_14_0_10_35_9]|nr:MAG: GNAT family N-acetyltransferase [Chlamydiae bacterium CG10_big_fil_rev_8_21_14_0_10_35_9]
MKFEITESPSSQEVEFLSQKINEEATEQRQASAFAVLVRGESGKILAGCNGSIVFGSIYTDQLWVDSSFRRKGVGKKLIEKVHEYGKENGCSKATVTTMSFQAPDFYKKLGYKVDFIRKGYNKNAGCIFMSKHL